VFLDVTGVEAGRRFDTVLQHEIKRANHVLVLMGPEWLDDLNSRLALLEIDYVRFEIAQALASKRKTIIPVLLREAKLPASGDLPSDLAQLPSFQAKTLRNDAWQYDVDRLLDAIGRPYNYAALALRGILAVLAAGTVVGYVAREVNLTFDTAQHAFWGALAIYLGSELAAAWYRVCRHPST